MYQQELELRVDDPCTVYRIVHLTMQLSNECDSGIHHSNKQIDIESFGPTNSDLLDSNYSDYRLSTAVRVINCPSTRSTAK